MSSVLKWVGGKRQLLDRLSQHFPKNFTRFYEPFGGSLTVTLWVLDNYPDVQSIFVADSNPRLVNLYKQIQKNPKKFLEVVDIYIELDSDYYELREKFNSTTNKLEEAVLMWLLNKKCFNGLYRVNKSGNFNVPEGKSSVNWEQQKENLKKFSDKINNKKISIECCDFQDFFKIHKPTSSDLVYVDPPYWDTFTAYTGTTFGEQEQKLLCTLCSELPSSVVCSNSNNDFIKNLYSDFEIHEVDARRSINCDASKRESRPVEVIMIRNSK